MANFLQSYRLIPSKDLTLSSRPTSETTWFDNKKDAQAFTKKTKREIQDLQYRLFVERNQSLLVILQAPDAGGKDGLIRKVFGCMNPQGCRVHAFGFPTLREQEYDFLWRVHACTPAQGMVAVFNRSHYEDVLAARVDRLVPKRVWRKRYGIINSFEKNLVHAGTRIIKLYLHISPQEQLRRLAKRLRQPDKQWKLEVSDFDARHKWLEYQKAYEDIFRRCNKTKSPWLLIPSDNKWYRDAVVAGILRDTLLDMDPKLPECPVDLSTLQQRYEEELSQNKDKSP